MHYLSGRLWILTLALIWAVPPGQGRKKSCRSEAHKAYPALACSKAKAEEDCVDVCQKEEVCPMGQTFQEFRCKNKNTIKMCCCSRCNATATLDIAPVGMSTAGRPATRLPKAKMTAATTPGSTWAHGWSSGSWVSTSRKSFDANGTSGEVVVARTTDQGDNAQDYDNGEYEEDDTTPGPEDRLPEEHEGGAERMMERSKSPSRPDCRANILKQYPEAECAKSETKEECRSICEAKGEETCLGSQGEIHKLNCRGEKPDAQGQITCCCSIRCEKAEKTQARLGEEFDQEQAEADSSGICVEVPREEIKARLKEECNNNDRVFVARKYCLEEKGGQYYCVKDGKCFGTHCKGCLKHECETEEGKQILNPPPEYMEQHLSAQDFEKGVAVNVDDMAGVVKSKQWCTSLTDRSACQATCRELGDLLCEGRALKYDHDDYCKRDAPACQCCCQPVCQAGGHGTLSTSPNHLLKSEDPAEGAMIKSVEQQNYTATSGPASEDYPPEPEDDAYPHAP